MEIIGKADLADPDTSATTAEPASIYPADHIQRSQVRDIADVSAIEVVNTVAVHLLTVAAVRCGLSDAPDADDQLDLAEARILINALAGLIQAAAPDLGSIHAAPLRDGLRAVRRAFAEASIIPDEPGFGPGDRFDHSAKGGAPGSTDRAVL